MSEDQTSLYMSFAPKQGSINLNNIESPAFSSLTMFCMFARKQLLCCSNIVLRNRLAVPLDLTNHTHRSLSSRGHHVAGLNFYLVSLRSGYTVFNTGGMGMGIVIS